MDKPCRVMVVVDDPMIVAALSDLLEGQGLRVITAASGGEAIRQLVATPCDAVVTNFNGAGSDGADLVAEIRRRHGPRLPVVVLASEDETARHLFARHRNLQILRKPAEITVICATLARVLPAC